MPRAKQRTPQLRAALIGEAASVLATEGVEGFTTRRVAERAGTSTPAVYELFGDRAGLIREVFFEGFRLLRTSFEQLHDTDDPRADLTAAAFAFRSFALEHPAIVQLMFARPFADFDPGPADAEAGRSTREYVTRQVRRCVQSGMMQADPTDIAHAVLALCQGMAAQETGGWLGTSMASRNRRWTLAVRSLITGLAP